MAVLYTWTELQFPEARRALYGYMHSTTTTPRRAWGDGRACSLPHTHAGATRWSPVRGIIPRTYCCMEHVVHRQSKIAAGRSIVVFEYRFEHLTHVRAIGVDC